MARQQANQKLILKIHSSRLRRNKWNLNISLEEAIDNDEIISLGESTQLRFIKELSDYKYTEEYITNLKKKINHLKFEPSNSENKKDIKKLYKELNNAIYIPQYVCVIMDKNKDFDRCCSKKGFFINGVKYKRLVGTTGGIKKSTIVFVAENLYDELYKRLNNGRNKEVPIVPAKLEAYQSLTCSVSIPVSDPKGVLVVNDCITYFKDNVIKIDDVIEDEPTVTEEEINMELVDSDGYGLILPSLSNKWANDIKEYGYTPSGYCIRNAFCKGMVFTFDFIDFANKIAKKDQVKDAWGNWHNINDIEVILTTSMLKLWNSYDSIEHYLKCCKKNHYTFSVTKCCPRECDNERTTNYQFLQSFELSDDDIEKLIKPTVDEIHDVLGNDYRKSLLFLRGTNVKEYNAIIDEPVFVKALMADKDMINDPFIKQRIHGMIEKKIKQAKIGALKVRGNYSIISGDPYSLCQSIFDLEITGLLKSRQCYSKYWIDEQVDKVVAFRAPMTCHNNIKTLNVTNTDEMKYWYKYMKTCLILSSWDSVTHALNGADKDE